LHKLDKRAEGLSGRVAAIRDEAVSEIDRLIGGKGVNGDAENFEGFHADVTSGGGREWENRGKMALPDGKLHCGRKVLEHRKAAKRMAIDVRNQIVKRRELDRREVIDCMGGGVTKARIVVEGVRAETGHKALAVNGADGRRLREMDDNRAEMDREIDGGRRKEGN
jgi:hypothetical protein